MIEYRNFQIEKFAISKISSFNYKNYPTSGRNLSLQTSKFPTVSQQAISQHMSKKKSLSLRNHFPIIILSFDLIHEFFQREKKIFLNEFTSL